MADDEGQASLGRGGCFRRSPTDLVGAMPEPVVVVDADGLAIVANGPALALLPGLRLGEPFVLALRTPDVIDAMRRVLGRRRSGNGAVERAGADRAPVRGLRRAAGSCARRGRARRC